MPLTAADYTTYTPTAPAMPTSYAPAAYTPAAPVISVGPTYSAPISPGFQSVLENNWTPSQDSSFLSRPMTIPDIQISGLRDVTGIVEVDISQGGNGFEVQRGGGYLYNADARVLTRLAPPPTSGKLPYTPPGVSASLFSSGFKPPANSPFRSPSPAPAPAPATGGVDAVTGASVPAAASPSIFSPAAPVSAASTAPVAAAPAPADLSAPLYARGASGDGYAEDADTSSSADFVPEPFVGTTKAGAPAAAAPVFTAEDRKYGDDAVTGVAPFASVADKFTLQGKEFVPNNGQAFSAGPGGGIGRPVQLASLKPGEQYFMRDGDFVYSLVKGGSDVAGDYSKVQTDPNGLRFSPTTLNSIDPSATERGISGPQAFVGSQRTINGMVAIPAAGVPDGYYQISTDPNGSPVYHATDAKDPNAYLVSGGMANSKQAWVEPKDETSFWKSQAAGFVYQGAVGLFGIMATYIMSEKNRQSADKIAREDRNMQLEALAMQYAARGGGGGGDGGSSVVGGNII